jgi:hypothetical protein
MNTYAKLIGAAAAVLVVAVVGYQFLPRNGGSGAQPTAPPTAQPSPSASPTPVPTASLVAHALTPFGTGEDQFDTEDSRYDSMTFAVTAPPSWEAFGQVSVVIDGDGPPDGAAVWFWPGDDLFSEPCRPSDEQPADSPVGPTVDDFVTALVEHPSLDVTAPVEVTLAGYSGMYLTLTIPDDISGCDTYRPFGDSHIYAQGPGQRWHMWVLDVNGVRVVVESNDFPGTSPQRLAEMQSIVDSLVITN